MILQLNIAYVVIYDSRKLHSSDNTTHDNSEHIIAQIIAQFW
jgi:hypothetical protein